MCYAGNASELRKAMAGSADATSLPTPISQGSVALENAAKKFDSLAQKVDSALKAAEAAHYGRAAEAANASIAEIKPIAENAARTSREVKGALDDQAQHQNETFRSLPHEGGKLQDGRPTQMSPPEKGWVEDAGLGWTWFSDYEERQERFQATNAEANQAMTRYSSQTSDVTGRTPEFAPPAPAPAPAPARAEYGPSAGGAMAGSGYSSTPSMGSGSAPASSSSSWAGSLPAGGSAAAVSSGAGSVPAGSQAPAGAGSAWTAGQSLPPGVVRGSDGLLYRQGPDGGWQRQNPHNGRWAPVSPGRPGAAGGRTGGGAAGRGVAGRPGGGFGPGSGSGSPLAGGRSGSGGFGPSGGSATGAAASGSGTGRGGGMMRGGAMAGGQQGQDSDEDEHERPSWLVETDDVFTNDMHKVAPPVLGALPHEEQDR